MAQVSVIIPVYNRIEELKRSLKSVLSQTIQDFEIFVVDDYSDTELKPLIDQFNDARIKYIKVDKKGNANVCRNIGIKLAEGKYIAMLDSDDEWLPMHLENKIKFIEEHSVDGVFGSYLVDDGEERREIVSRPFKKNESMTDYILTDGKAATPTQVYKAGCAKSVLWDESLLRHQDFDFSIRFAERYKFQPLPDVTCIVHWKKGEKRNESIESQFQFIKKHSGKIKPQLYHNYFRALYNSIRLRGDVSIEIKNTVKKESNKFIQYCSLNDCLAIEGTDRSKISRFFLRFKYCLRVLFA